MIIEEISVLPDGPCPAMAMALRLKAWFRRKRISLKKI